MKEKVDLLWMIKLAWKEMRRNRLRLLLFVSSICFGVAAVVVIESFRLNLEEAVANESKSLLGSDLTISSRRPYQDLEMAKLDSLGGDRASEIRFSSMAYFPKQDEAKLIQVRAQEGVFPFYGEFLTEPMTANLEYKKRGGALVDRNLQIQLSLTLMDSVRVGTVNYPILGFFSEIPGEAVTASVFSGPRIYIPISGLNSSLLDRGSRVTRRFRFKFEEDQSISENQIEALREEFPRPDFRVTSVEDAAENLGNALRDLYRFLGIAGLVALLLGSIGIASSIFVYIRRKTSIIATLRCVGFDPKTCTRIFTIQALLVGMVSSLIGVILGWILVSSIPELLQDFIPVEIPGSTRWSAVAMAFFAGCGISLISSLLPLSEIKSISPMSALRSLVSSEASNSLRKWATWKYLVIVILAFLFFSVYLTGDLLRGVSLIMGILLVILVLLAVATLLMKGLNGLKLKKFSYPVRQGISNLYRPNNQTSTLLVILGLGAFLISCLSIIENSLLGQFDAIGAENSPNTLIFDIQRDQIEGLRSSLASEEVKIVDDAPVVTMRLSTLNGRPVTQIREDSTSKIPEWSLTREYRSTFRNNLKSSEKVLEGEWHGDFESSVSESRISLESSLASDLGVGLGDQLGFNVQGMELTLTVSSLREVNWFAFESNFFVVFEEGILEDAPRFHIVLGKTNPEKLPMVQRRLVKEFPNISVIDASLVLVKASDIIGKVSLIIRIMALFCIFTGIVVLLASLSMSRGQRFKENALLKTLGAKSKQISAINAIEYLLLGALASFTGILLAIAASWAAMKFIFEIPLRLPIPSLMALLVGIILLTVVVGFLSAYGMGKKAPMEVLRAEVV